MALRKCPRCELNYILDDGALCSVCREEVRGTRGKDESVALCSVCGELPALPGEDMCKVCLAELRSIELLSTDGEDEPPMDAEIDPEPVSSLDEIEAVEPLGDELEEDIEEPLGDALDEETDMNKPRESLGA